MNLPPRNTSAVGDPNAGVVNTPPDSPSTDQVEAANTQLDYYKAAMQQNAGLTQGAEHMASLAQKYAPQGGSIEDIAHAIRQGIGV
jgi:hypothetical protein